MWFPPCVSNICKAEDGDPQANWLAPDSSEIPASVSEVESNWERPWPQPQPPDIVYVVYTTYECTLVHTHMCLTWSMGKKERTVCFELELMTLLPLPLQHILSVCVYTTCVLWMRKANSFVLEFKVWLCALWVWHMCSLYGLSLMWQYQLLKIVFLNGKIVCTIRHYLMFVIYSLWINYI